MDENKPTIFDKIGVLSESHGWQSFGALPQHIMYFAMNVRGGGLLEAISPEQYVAEHPDWAKAIDDDYDKVMAERAEKARLSEAAKTAESEGVKFIAGLTTEQRARLSKLLEADPTPPVTPVPAASA